jgi:hypothetical protein
MSWSRRVKARAARELSFARGRSGPRAETITVCSDLKIRVLRLMMDMLNEQ